MATPSPTPNPFPVEVENKQRYNKLLSEPAADKIFVIYFTPRSGSTWLTQALKATRQLGYAGESFNPNFAPKAASHFGASTLEEYIHALKRKRNFNGCFSFQVTYFHIKKTFRDERCFLSHFGSCPAVWLIRKDIVAQAISLAKKAKTRVAHSTQFQGSSLQELDDLFEYDHELIHSWLKHILAAEIETERFFSQHRIRPLRISYEDMFEHGAEGTTQRIACHLGLNDTTISSDVTFPEKIGTEQNKLFAERFRRDAPSIMYDVNRIRKPWINRLNRGGFWNLSRTSLFEILFYRISGLWQR